MKKRGYAALFVIIILVTFVYAAELDNTELDPEIKKLNDEGFKFTGPGIEYNDGTLVIPKDGTVAIPENFNGDLKVQGGTVLVPKSFKGKIEIKDATIKSADGIVFKGEGSYSKSEGFVIKDGTVAIPESFNENIKAQGGIVLVPKSFSGKIDLKDSAIYLGGNIFQGTGSYSKSEGFTIEEGNLNDLLISNGKHVRYDEEKKTITGVIDKEGGCKNENEIHICKIWEEDVGEGTKFIYEEKKQKITLIGRPGITTMPDAQLDAIYEIKYEEHGEALYLGNMQIDIENSRIFLKQGDGIKIKGVPEITAEDGDMQIIFEKEEGEIIINPILKIPFKVLDGEKSVINAFKEAGYGDEKSSFNARKEFYESIYPDEKYEGTKEQNNKLLSDIKKEFYYKDKDSRVAINLPNVDWNPQGPSEPKKLNRDPVVYIQGKKFYAEISDDPKYAKTDEEIKEIRKKLENNKDLDYIKQLSLELGLPEELTLAICVVESYGCTGEQKCNGKGACGQFQVKWIAVKDILKDQPEYQGYKDNQLNKITNKVMREVESNSQTNAYYGIKYFAKQLGIYDGSMNLALASYNAGRGAVNTEQGIPQYTETLAYVPKVLGIYDGLKKTTKI